MPDFFPGQRWISDTELHMGLGTVLTVDHRSVTIVFLATGETRIYAKDTAPLTRVKFGPGDSIQSHENWTLKVESTCEINELIIYKGRRDNGDTVELEEGALDNFIQLNRPTDRLLSGQIDQNKWFELRYETRQHQNRLAHSDLRGLTGARTSLIPHQLYIAHDIANRYAPRVLLADEVGLGKTIEAGLILHHQLLSERAKRVLIIVPESLLHQWLVEMLRRFNLHFSIFDEARCLDEEETGMQDNPFHTEQLALCSLGFLVKHPDRFQQALKGDWDLLIVDEAHHLQWSAEQKSLEYEQVETLAQQTKGVLLLTATPEQLGKASHFARLRLLDPNRFPSYDKFLEEEKSYEPIAQAVKELLDNVPLSPQTIDTIHCTIKEEDNQRLLDIIANEDNDSPQTIVASHAAKEALVEHLLDRHGTGRVLFRNTRAAIKGFPQRVVTAYALPLPDAYQKLLADFQTAGLSDPLFLLCPEQAFQTADASTQPHWTQIDPRIDWLSAKLKQLKPQKVLVITASAQTVLDLAESLRTNAGLHAAVFHEKLSIIERDRAAAYFADEEYGTQVLICSEIGSEGRNFQFAHHLILFDLPLHPDLLEQRIGRLDRIGQTADIQIHIPYLENSAQAIMYAWYHEGLSAFEHTCPAGHTVFVQVKSALIEALHQIDDGIEDLPALIATTKKLHEELNDALHRGRDQLLELNSFRPQIAADIKQRALTADADSSLHHYLENVFDCYGIDIEDDTINSYIVRPSDHMQTSSFPGLHQDGMTITFDRATALSYEDMHYITWEHPLTTGAMEAIVSSELGNTAVIAIKDKDIAQGILLLESLYILEPVSSDVNLSKQLLPPTLIRLVIDQNGSDFSARLSRQQIEQSQIKLTADTVKKILRLHKQSLRDLITISDQLAQQQSPTILTQVHNQTKETLNREFARLKALYRINPNVRTEEIDFFESQLNRLDSVLDTVKPRLDAVRVIVTT
ncbi:MAG: RNA polymerase-associated protein RapA [Gammaproteobacteria bacterium]|nr:RNA polymerase-associated protein RapA [Gammaproteobacteria bacterium]